jgi:hypothetical protein
MYCIYDTQYLLPVVYFGWEKHAHFTTVLPSLYGNELRLGMPLELKI